MQLVKLSPVNVRRRGLALPSGVGRRGVYRLTFRDGQHYVGRTDDIVVRMGGHCRTYGDSNGDIVGITYRPVPEGDLDAALVDLDHVVGASTIRRSDPAVARAEIREPRDPHLARVRWIETHVADREMARRPPEPPAQRERTRPKFERLAAHPDFPLLRDLVHRYIAAVIPAPMATERRNWVITSMPSTARTRVWHRLLCLSVNNVEALTVGEQVDGERRTVVGFMSADPLPGSGRSGLPADARRAGTFVAPARYATVGEVSQLGFDSLAGMRALLGSDLVLDHVGTLVMRLVERGRGMYGRFHDYNLADAVLDAETPLRVLIP